MEISRASSDEIRKSTETYGDDRVVRPCDCRAEDDKTSKSSNHCGFRISLNISIDQRTGGLTRVPSTKIGKSQESEEETGKREHSKKELILSCLTYESAALRLDEARDDDTGEEASYWTECLFRLLETSLEKRQTIWEDDL